MKLPKMSEKKPVEVDAIKDKRYAWCSCGLSEKQPFCDGAHRGFEFVPKIFTESEDKKIYLCNCKKTSKRGCNHRSIKCITHNLWDQLDQHINGFFERFNF